MIAVSAGMMRDVLAAYPSVDPDKVRVVHNGIDTERVPPGPRHRRDGAARASTRTSRAWCTSAGSPARRVCPTCCGPPPSSRPRSSWCCSPAPRTRPRSRPRSSRSPTALKATRRGRGLGAGDAAQAEVIQVLTHGTVFVCPSVYEPMGIVNLEAMACETAVVATATGGIPEVVADGETGLLVPITQAGRRYRHPAGPGPVRARPGRRGQRGAGRPGPGVRARARPAGGGRSSTSPGRPLPNARSMSTGRCGRPDGGDRGLPHNGVDDRTLSDRGRHANRGVAGSTPPRPWSASWCRWAPSPTARATARWG